MINVKKFWNYLVLLFSISLLFAGCSKYENPNDLGRIGEWINSHITVGNVKYAFNQYSKNFPKGGASPGLSTNPLPGKWSGTSFNADYVQAQKFDLSANNSFVSYFGWLKIKENSFYFTAWFFDPNPQNNKHYFYAYFNVNFSNLSEKNNNLTLTTIYYQTIHQDPTSLKKYGWITDQSEIPKPK